MNLAWPGLHAQDKTIKIHFVVKGILQIRCLHSSNDKIPVYM